MIAHNRPLTVLCVCCFAAGHLSADALEKETQQAREETVGPRVTLLSDEEAWKLLAAEPDKPGERLPVWARALVTALPRTTAAMLRLDYLHRVDSPLDAKLRAKIRWTAAHANRCAYARAYALDDLRRAGAGEPEIEALVNGQPTEDDLEQQTLGFARKLTLDASSVTDEEVAALSKGHGDKQLVAIVLLVAYANFQDRLLLSLGLAAGEDVSLEPIAVRSKRDNDERYEAPPRKKPEKVSGESAADARGWSKISFDQLQKQLNSQRARQPRIPVPKWDDLQRELDFAKNRRRPLRIRWSLVSLGYQPDLAKGWGSCTGTFHRESRQDRVFEESLFWVVTRSIDCFY